MGTILVSNCLLGCECRYKGDGCKCEKVLELSKNNTIIGICPEQTGGLSTPRNPSEIVGDRVISSNGTDVTKEYMKGAQTALFLAQLNNIDYAVLKANSPSCGNKMIYDGTFTGTKIPGEGVTAKLLRENGFKVISEEEL